MTASPASMRGPRLRRCAAAFASLLVAVLTTGCHHKAHVSRHYPPPPPSHSGSHSGTTAHRAPAPVVIPGPAVDDNRIASGRVTSSETGLASWYGPPYANRAGANGKIYDQNAMTAAHRTLPFGTMVRVTNLQTNQAATVQITDRGPFVRGRILDLSKAAAQATGVYRMGVAQVKIEVLQQRADADLSGGKWCVQVGAFLDRNNALRLQSDLQHRYATSAKVIQFQGPTGSWVRVNPVGGGRTQATQIADSIRLAEPDAQAYLVRLD